MSWLTIPRQFLLVVGLIAISLCAGAQLPSVDAVVQPGSILIGEPARLEVICRFDPLRFSEPKLRMPDSIPHLEIEPAEQVIRSTDANGWALDRHPYVFTSFDSGRWSIPTIEVTFTVLPGDSIYTTITPIRWIDVRYAPADTTQPLRDLKPIRAAAKPIPWQTYAWWAFGAMLFFTLLAYLITRYRSWKQRQPIALSLHPDEAYAQALAKLDALAVPESVDANAIYQWHVQLKQVLRDYFVSTAREYWVQGTSTDWLILITAIEPVAERGTSAAVLRGCDAAIFARYMPEREAMQLRAIQARKVLAYGHQSITSKSVSA